MDRERVQDRRTSGKKLRRHSTYVVAGKERPLVRWSFLGVNFLCSAVALCYAPMVVQYGIYNIVANPLGPLGGAEWAKTWTRWNDEVMAPLTGRAFADGPGSVTSIQAEKYGRRWYFMSVHQICGGIMCMCIPILVFSYFRRDGRQKYHRLAGRIYVVAHLFNLYGSMGFLVKHTFPHVWPETKSATKGGIYGGSIFCLTLWLYWTAAALSLGMGLFHISRGEIQRHRSWMAVNYGTTMGAPGLRLIWGLFGYLTTYRMDEINTASVVIFILFMLNTAAAYTGAADSKELKSTHAGPLVRVMLLLGALTTVGVLVNQYLLRFGAFGVPVRPSLFSESDAGRAHAYKLFWSRPGAEYVAAGFVASTSTAVLLGAVLIPRCLASSAAVRGPIGYLYAASLAIHALMTTTISPVSFAYFLHFPAEVPGHFYQAYWVSLFHTRALVVLWKVACVCLCMFTLDPSRTVEWVNHSYGDATFLSWTFLAMPLFATLVPTFEDAWSHSALLGLFLGELLSYIASIYLFVPEKDVTTSAVRVGLFGGLFRKAKAD